MDAPIEKSDTYKIDGRSVTQEDYDQFVQTLGQEKFNIGYEESPDDRTAMFYRLKDKIGNLYEVFESRDRDSIHRTIRRIAR